MLSNWHISWCELLYYIYLYLMWLHNLAEHDHSDPLLLVWEGDWKQVGSLSWTSAGINC